MEDWGIQILQFVWFKDDAEALRAPAVFRLLKNEDAENTQVNRTPSANAPFLSIASTALDDRNYQVMVSPGRIDYTIARPDRSASGPWAWKLSDGLKVLETEVQNVIGAAKHVGTANRLALVATLLRNVSTAEQARTFVVDRISGDVPAGAIDLMFQLNIRKTSTTTGQQYNRLARFSSASVQEMTLTVVNGRASPTTVGPERHIATLMLDLNTTLEASIYEPNAIAALFREFAEEMKRLAKDGTVNGLVSE